jgi:hypothetical protein
VSGPVEDRSDPTPRDPWPDAYEGVATAVGVVFVLIGAISLAIALRQLVLPASTGDLGIPSVFGPGLEGKHAALRSFLGALAFAVPGLLVVAWHRREGNRRRQTAPPPGVTWSRSLSLHLVALISLVIATGAIVAMLDSFRDSVWPQCYPSFFGGGSTTLPTPPVAGDPVTPLPPISIEPPITIPDPSFAPEPECFPQTAEALRSALDAGLVAAVAGGTWAWHLRRGRRIDAAPPAGP